jgi:hypothetical protein
MGNYFCVLKISRKIDFVNDITQGLGATAFTFYKALRALALHILHKHFYIVLGPVMMPIQAKSIFHPTGER